MPSRRYDRNSGHIPNRYGGMMRIASRVSPRQLLAAIRLVRHAYGVVRGGQLRFRLETFGLYYPALPYTADWWRFPGCNLLLMLRQSKRYSAWVIEMEEIRRSGAGAWWDRHGRREWYAAGDSDD